MGVVVGGRVGGCDGGAARGVPVTRLPATTFEGGGACVGVGPGYGFGVSVGVGPGYGFDDADVPRVEL